MKTTEIAPTRCWSCGDIQDCATHPHDRTPEPGHFAVCWNCGALAQYDEALRLIEPSLDAMIECQQQAPKTWKIINALQKAVKHRSRLR